MSGKTIKYTEEELVYIKNNLNTKTCKEIGNILGRHPVGVQAAIKKYLNIPKKPVHTNRQDVEFNHNTSKLLNDSLESYYWLGFLAADGNLYKGKRCKYYRLSVGVHEKDIDHLQQFISFLEYTGTIIVRKKVRFHIIYLRINEEERNRLASLSIVPNKSLSLKPPELNEQQNLAYIKGYIDGDGCVRLVGKYKNLISINILGTKEMLEWIAKVLNSTHRISCKNKIHSITLTGQTARKAREILLNIETPYLNRKWMSDITSYT